MTGTVDIFPERCDKLPGYINDNENYKIIILEKGALEIKNGNEICTVKAPALIQLSQKDNPDYRVLMNIKAFILFFNPTVIREEFVFDKLDSGEFEKTWGSSFYQDYVLIRDFAEAALAERVNELTLNSLKRLKELYMSTEKELTEQRDGFWPCRSRSYLMELLYYIEYTFYVNSSKEETPGQDDFALITDYMTAFEQNDHAAAAKLFHPAILEAYENDADTMLADLDEHFSEYGTAIGGWKTVDNEFVDAEGLEQLNRASEAYVQHRFEKEFKTLNFYKAIT